MANEAQKKAAKRRSEALKLYLSIAGVANIIYVLVWLFVIEASWSNWRTAGVVVLALSYVASVYSVVNAKAEGLEANMSNDLFIITTFVQLSTLYSDKFWLIFLVVPGYALYKGGSLLYGLSGMLGGGGGVGEVEGDDATGKKSKKQLKQEALAQAQAKPGQRMVRQQYR